MKRYVTSGRNIYEDHYYAKRCHEDPDCRVCSHEAGRALVNEYEGGKTPLFHKNDARWPHHTRAEHVPDCPANKEIIDLNFANNECSFYPDRCPGSSIPEKNWQPRFKKSYSLRWPDG